MVLVACRMSSTTVLISDINPGETEGETGRLYQWRFNLKTGAVEEEMLEDAPSDFPRLNEQFLGRKMQYGYTARLASTPMPLFDAIVKYDFKNNRSEAHKFGNERYGGEAVFVPRPNATLEDDGWLITFVYDTEQNTSEMLVINAKDMAAEPIARVILPQRVPYGFHGIWVEETNLI